MKRNRRKTHNIAPLPSLSRSTTSDHGLKSSVMIEDVGALLEMERKQEEKNGMLKIMRPYKIDWNAYYPLEDIYEYFDALEGM